MLIRWEVRLLRSRSPLLWAGIEGYDFSEVLRGKRFALPVSCGSSGVSFRACGGLGRGYKLYSLREQQRPGLGEVAGTIRAFLPKSVTFVVGGDRRVGLLRSFTGCILTFPWRFAGGTWRFLRRRQEGRFNNGCY